MKFLKFVHLFIQFISIVEPKFRSTIIVKLILLSNLSVVQNFIKDVHLASQIYCY